MFDSLSHSSSKAKKADASPSKVDPPIDSESAPETPPRKQVATLKKTSGVPVRSDEEDELFGEDQWPASPKTPMKKAQPKPSSQLPEDSDGASDTYVMRLISNAYRYHIILALRCWHPAMAIWASR
jgi:hypothetical protein